MEPRENFQRRYDAELREWGAKLALVKIHSENLSVETKRDLKPYFDAIEEKFAVAKMKLSELPNATDDTLEDLVQDVDQAWLDFRAAAQTAYDAVKNHNRQN